MDLSGLAPDMAAALSTVCQRLELGFGEVTFRRTAQGFAVSDFDPAPDVGAWAPDAAEVALEGLWQALVGSVAGKLQQLVRERRAQRKGGGGPHRGSGPDRGEDSGSAAGHGSGAGGSESAG
jgi:hypothetical protein